MKPILMLLSDDVIRDAERNRISIINIFEGLEAQSFPLLMHKLSVFCLLAKDKDDADEVAAEIRVTLDRKNIIDALPITVDFKGAVHNRTTLNILGVVIQKPGVITASLYSKSKKIASYSAEIRAVPKAERG